ncbi:hypothetical protein ASPBRDRAFT_312923 [Aspergillus brasiliensis CBS 101740]|uniref:Uncharacterized protein n=1 Tax=Aspergillus brasiliensis (strain CBS 101740 / IMI 381727 / IBT 21946) TaxID=767769 RepID=A0A1L9UAP6_ASPBC|nr:hypothetical protein ASPBRDRAFT_312923 [Aspergillus brasiliensis CBS 101740]
METVVACDAGSFAGCGSSGGVNLFSLLVAFSRTPSPRKLADEANDWTNEPIQAFRRIRVFLSRVRLSCYCCCCCSVLPIQYTYYLQGAAMAVGVKLNMRTMWDCMIPETTLPSFARRSDNCCCCCCCFVRTDVHAQLTYLPTCLNLTSYMTD